MPSPRTFQLLADAVLALHALLALFVVIGLPLALLGRRRRWRLVDAAVFRRIHLAAVLVIVAQAWLGAACPLTTLEQWLRRQGQTPGYSGSFIEHWLQRLLFYQAPGWVFVTVYTLYGVLVVLCWWRLPPRPRR